MENNGRAEFIREVIDILCWKRVCLAEVKLTEQKRRLVEEILKELGN